MTILHLHRATECEMDGEIAPDADRFMTPPRRTEDDNLVRSRFWAAYLSVLLIALMSTVLWFGW